MTRPSCRFLEEWFYSPAQFHGERLSVPVYTAPGWNTNPTFADAVLLDIRSFGSIETNADGTLQHLLVIVGTLRIDTEPVWQVVGH